MRKAEVLLAYLALAPGLRHPRERLINLLWSDRGDEQARNSLRQCLSSIRKALSDAADLILQVDRSTVSLRSELVEVDAHEFERLALEGDFESLNTAVDLYQGEFLEGISIRDPACQEWLDGERSRFKRQYIELLSNLSEIQLVTHDFRHAIQSAEQLVEQDPLVESGWRLLMHSYYENGNRNHALKAYQRCEQILRQELDVEPEAETTGLRDQIAASAVHRARESVSIAAGASPEARVSTDHSIAVLPFDNLSGDPEQEYFSDGITDSIILNLSLFPGLNVKSRNSSFAFKQQIKSIGEISQELDVDYVVEGSTRKSEQRIRITVQLIEATSGNQVWGKRYDAGIENLFDLEEDLSRTIAATVTGQIESDLQRIALNKGANDQQSYDLLLNGIYHFQRFTRQDTVIAIDELNRCLKMDPDNVRAHQTLCGCHVMDYLSRWTRDYRASLEIGEKHIRRALELDPEFPPALVSFGELLTFNGELEEAVIYFDKALEINPNDTDALTSKSLNLQSQCDFETALALAERALALDPYHPWAEWELAGSQYMCGRYEDALNTIAGFRTSPGFVQIHEIAANVKLDRIDAARQTLRDFLQDCRENMLSMPQTIDEWYAYTRENYLYQDPGLNQDLIDCLVEAGLQEALTENPAGEAGNSMP